MAYAYEPLPYGQTVDNKQLIAYQRADAWGQDPTETWAPGFERPRTYLPGTWTAQDEEVLQEQQEIEFDGIFSVIYEYCVKPLTDGLSDGVDYVMNKAIEMDDDLYYDADPRTYAFPAAPNLQLAPYTAPGYATYNPGPSMGGASQLFSTSRSIVSAPAQATAPGQISTAPGSRLVHRDELLRTGVLCTADEGTVGSLAKPYQTHVPMPMQTVQPMQVAVPAITPLPVKYAKVL